MAFHATLPYTLPGGDDNWRYHAADIYRLGGCVSDPKLAEILAKNSGRAAQELQRWGVPFTLDSAGRLAQFITDGSDYPRACYTGPYTANHISQALCAKVRELALPVLEEHYVFQLAVSGGRVVGVWALPEGLPGTEDPARHLVFLGARSVVLATGGAGGIYGHNVFPPGAVGDGYAMALAAGASVVNIEFLQIALCSPKTSLACSGSIMRAMPRFVNDKGEELALPGSWPELVFDKGASWPLSYENPTHKIDLLVARELEAGGKVYLDFSANPRNFAWESLPQRLVSLYKAERRQDLGQERKFSPLARLREINQPVVQWLAERGVRLEAGERLEIHPSVQHFQGGVWIDAGAETKLPGLFAAGEAAGGQHGANRPGGNALMDAQVFGRIAGERAAQVPFRLDRNHPQEPKLQKDRGTAAGEILTHVRGLMDRYAAVIRWPEGLKVAAQELEELAKLEPVPARESWDRVLEAKAAVLVARAVVKAQALRKESRGPHLYFTEADGEAMPTDPEYQRSVCLSGPALNASWIKWRKPKEDEK
jgi:succinate dehydrogenase / fumarate reductase flavoprotein subunit